MMTIAICAYGPISERVVLRWRNGLYLPEAREGWFEEMVAEASVDNLFLDLLRRFTKQGRNVSPNRSATYAPTVFADQTEAKQAKPKVKAPAFEAAMERLLAASKVKVVEEGPQSRKRQRLAETGPVEGFKTSDV